MKAIIAWFAASSAIALAMTAAAFAQDVTPASAQDRMHYSDTVNGNCSSAGQICTVTFRPVDSPSGAVLTVQKVSCLMTTGTAFAGYVYLSKTNNTSAQEYFAAPPLATTVQGFTLTTLAESTVFFVEPNASPTVTFNTVLLSFLSGPICTVSGIVRARMDEDPRH
jgi:hypothetical protein